MIIFINSLPLEVNRDTTLFEVEERFQTEYPDAYAAIFEKYKKIILLEHYRPCLMWKEEIHLDGSLDIKLYSFAHDDQKLPFYKILEYRNHPSKKIVTNVLANGKLLTFEGTGLSIKFHSTFRIPNDGNSYPLPPSLSELKLYGLGDDAFVMPMWQREAMWMSFHVTKGMNVALKVFVGDINVVTRKYETDEEKNVTTFGSDQNFLVCPGQKWLDGMRTPESESGEEFNVNQFVAMPLHDPSTIESQLQKIGYISEMKGGISFRVFPLLCCSRDFSIVTHSGKVVNGNEKRSAEEILEGADSAYVIRQYPVESHRCRDTDGITHSEATSSTSSYGSHAGNLRDTPGKVNYNKTLTLRDIGIREGDRLGYDYGRCLFVINLTKKVVKININEFFYTFTISKLKWLVNKVMGIPYDQQRLIYAGRQLEDRMCLSDYDIQPFACLHLVLRLRGGGSAESDTELEPRMGMSVGGLIRQKIYRGYFEDYDTRYPGVSKITIANSALFPIPLPRPKITFHDYIKKGYPWYDLYDEEQVPIATSSTDHHLQGLSRFDRDDKSKKLMCRCKKRYVEIMYNPCKHAVCGKCFKNFTIDNNRVICDRCVDVVEFTSIRFLYAASRIDSITLKNGRVLRFQHGVRKADRTQTHHLNK